MDQPPTEAVLGKESKADQKLRGKIELLEQELERERDERREDRFLCLIIVLMLVDILLLDGAANSAVVFVVFVLQVVFLFVIAKRLGIEQMVGILNRMINTFTKRGSD